MSYEDTYVIVPAYNEASVLGGVIKELRESFPNVVAVDDGSTDRTAAVVRRSGATLVRHPLNLGQGAAIQTGIEYALKSSDARYFVTFDADGQHKPEDAKRMVDELRRDLELDIVLGSRFIGTTEGMGHVKKALLKGAVLFNRVITGIRLSDAHNGLRAMRRRFASELDMEQADMSHASELVEVISQQGARYKEMPVTIRYTDYSKRKGQSVFNSLNIAFDLILAKLSGKP
ncbi:MAG: glycosyltransferase family 2 protein [bacterium]|nr:glycosyltransferase family 2 protein [bacterium]MDZ4248210.1 glycosyltransferase family 2 protein [Patescibacteria group bacterium]